MPPRGGQYELFTNGGVTYSYDDASISMPTPEGMFDWIRNQDPSQWHGLTNYPNSNVAFYLTPQLYLLWKIKWYTG